MILAIGRVGRNFRVTHPREVRSSSSLMRETSLSSTLLKTEDGVSDSGREPRAALNKP